MMTGLDLISSNLLPKFLDRTQASTTSMAEIDPPDVVRGNIKASDIRRGDANRYALLVIDVIRVSRMLVVIT